MSKTCPHAASGCDYPDSECAGHCASKQQPKALRLADLIDANLAGAGDAEISAELRRLYAQNEDYGATIDYLTCENAEQIGEIVALKEQWDGLLNAVLFMLSNHCNLISRFDVNAVRAAIAKAEGEKS